MRRLLGLSMLLSALVAAGCVESNSSPPAPPAAAGRGGPSAPSAAPEEAASGSATPLNEPAAGALVINQENSKIEFVGSKPEGKHNGGFQAFLGGIELPGDDVTAAKIAVEIDANSLYSDNPKLTAHLKSPDFFDVKAHPKASFVSTAVKAGPGKD